MNTRLLGYTILRYTTCLCTFLAGVLHIALIPLFFTLLTIDVIVFFIVSGLAQMFWVIPVIKIWSKFWYYAGIGGTIILIIMYVIAVPGSGYPVNELGASIVLFQIAFIILYSIIMIKNSRL
ncbi:MAG TPA: hypothetical protein VJ697_10860 [Nitrososphaeraceae archaeon]|nr:hypothetical protein [Nitrososphaeraceae archaeon]